MAGALLQIKVTPRAGRTAIAGWRDDVLLLKIAAAPVDNAANAAVVELLSSALSIPKRDITIESGHTSRSKRVRIEGLAQDEIRRRLGE